MTTATQAAQRSSALDHANEIRFGRATLKADIRAGNVTIASVLVDPPAFVHTMRVYDLMLAVPRVGRTKALRVLARNEISAARTVGMLSVRQRLAIVNALGGRR